MDKNYSLSFIVLYYISIVPVNFNFILPLNFNFILPLYGNKEVRYGRFLISSANYHSICYTKKRQIDFLYFVRNRETFLSLYDSDSAMVPKIFHKLFKN